MNYPDVRKRLNDLGHVAFNSTPAEFAETIKAETAFYARIIKGAGIKPIE